MFYAKNMISSRRLIVTCLLISWLVNESIQIHILDGLKIGTVYQFELSTEMQLTNAEKTKTVDEQESTAIVYAQLLRWDTDSNKRILVVWADNCVNTFCPTGKQGDGSTGKLQLFSIWRGSKITELLSQTSPTSENWDIAKSILLHFQYELETAKLRSAGLCDTQFSEKDPVSRRLVFCRLPEQASILGKLMDHNSTFAQTSQYFFDASSKLRQLVIREQYELSSPMISTAHTVLISQSRLKLVDQSQSTYSPKDDGVDFNIFVEILKKENGLHHLADSIEELFTRATMTDISPSISVAKGKCGSLGGVEVLQGLLPTSKTGTALKALIRLSKDLRSVDETRLYECLNFISQTQRALVAPFVEALSVASGSLAQRTVFRFLDANQNEDFPPIKQSYLTMLAHNLWPEKVVKEVLKYFEKSIASHTDVDEYLALAVAALARRSGDKEIQDQLLKTLDNVLSSCQSDSCLESVLRALGNLAHSKTADHVGKYFCHKSATIAKEALGSLRSVDPSYWTNQTLEELAQVYANECPTGSSDSSCRAIAVELLLKVRPNQRWLSDVGTLLLRPLLNKRKPWRSSQHREVLTYALAKLFDSSNADDKYKLTVKSAIHEILNDDFTRLAIGGFSDAHSDVLADFGFTHAFSQLNMEFHRGVVKRSSVEVGLRTKDGRKAPLLLFGLFSRGLESLAGDSDATYDDDVSSDSQEAPDPTAGMRLTLLDQLQPPLTFFTGHSALMSAVWSANGEPMTAFEGRFLANNMRGTVPLANGQTVVIQLDAAVWWRITGAVEVSLWYKNGHTTIKTELAYLMDSAVEVRHGDTNHLSLRDESTLSTGLTMDFITDVDFSNSPFQLCMQMNHHPIQLRYRNLQKRFADSSSKKKQTWKRQVLRRIPGRCYVTEPKISRSCNSVLQTVGRA